MAETASEVVAKDLTYMCEALREEFGRMSGKRLLIIGGAGFLGYYLVQSVLHWNETGRNPNSLTVYDNYIRGIPTWLSALEGKPNLELVRHDITHPLPANIPDFQYVVHGGSIASPIFYRKYPIETMDANVGGLRTMLDYAVRQKQAGKPLEGFLFYSSSEIYGDPTPENIPTPETYRGNVSCTGARACYDESSATAKRCACSSRSNISCRSRWPARSTTTGRGSRSPTNACWRLRPRRARRA